MLRIIDLSIIIVSFNTKDLLKQCLESIYHPQNDGLQIIVVDNASSDGSSQMVRKLFPKVELIQNKKNVGFSRANNQGLKLIEGDYILFLNSDTIVKPKALEALVQWHQSQGMVGICSPQLLNQDGSIQANGGLLPNLFNIVIQMLFIDDVPFIKLFLSGYQKDAKYFEKTREVGWVSGATMMASRDCLEDIGMWDENIFMYGEDIDLCWRARKRLWHVYSVNEAQITHLAHGSGSKAKAIVGEYRGLQYLFKKHKPKWQEPVLDLVLRFGARLRMMVFGKILRDQNRYEIYKQALAVVR